MVGRARADVFRRHYMHQTVKVDTQSAYLGTTSRADLIKTVGLMSNKRDPRAPVKPGAEDLEDEILENHPELSALVIERKRLKTILKAECRTAAGAKVLQPENTGSITGSLVESAVSGMASSAAH